MLLDIWTIDRFKPTFTFEHISEDKVLASVKNTLASFTNDSLTMVSLSIIFMISFISFNLSWLQDSL